MTVSAPERAVLELFDELPAHESFHQADMLMEGMSDLAPRRLQALLTRCRSVKVKRLFFFFADLYAGKIVAALDRQHPRDLFDVRDLLANEGVGDALRRAFLVYLISHDRPMAEVLGARRKNIAMEFDRGFVGMTREATAIEDLLTAREAMVAEVIESMPDIHREYLLAFERGEPMWSALGLEAAAGLPAVRWREHNLDTIDRAKRAALIRQLEQVLAR